MRVNREIRAPSVRVISEKKGQLGVMSVREALTLAEEENLDLVEIAPNATPPVCKIVDFGKLKYHQTKKEKESKKSQHVIKIKEIKVTPNIDIHDFNTKLRHAKDFLEKGNKVRITCSFRGREMLHMNLGEDLVKRFCADLEEYSTVEAPMKRMGKSVSLVLGPSSKKSTKPSVKKPNNEEKTDA